MTNVPKNKHKNILRFVFLNLLINIFIIMCYFYLSEIFGSISTYFITSSNLLIQIGLVLIVFTLLSILAGWHHGFIAGFLGELFYQIAYYNTVYLQWCIVVAIWGFLCGVFKYKPLKYQERKNILFTFFILVINSFIMVFIISILQKVYFSINKKFELLFLEVGFKFFLITLIFVDFLVPILLIIYDKCLATEERHLYFIILTHHPIYMSDHTFYFKFGRTYIYFCSRCSGVMIGGLIAFFFTHLIEVIYKAEFNPELAVFLCVILPIPGLIDWGTQRMLLRKSTTESRLFTGFIIGNALHFMSFTNKYYFFMLFLLTLYFSILGTLIFLGHKKEMRLNKETEETFSS
ncbi:MAG: DUF2085 domain-containing protein [Candidatus Hermodarchaeota archaeon]